MGDNEPIWARQPDEPERWYGRFELYRILGPNRSLDRAFRLTAQLAGLTAQRANSHWRQIARRWDWEARATAWDAAEAVRRHDLHATHGLDPLAQRLAMVDELLQAVHAVLLNADLRDMNKEEARRNLPTLRVFFRDLLAAHRDESDRAQTAGGANAEVIPFSADELRAAQGELARWRALWEGAPPDDGAPLQTLRDLLVTLYPDEASIRRVIAQARLDAAHIGFSPRAVDTWHAFLAEAGFSGRLAALMAVAVAEYRDHRALHRAVAAIRRQLP